MKTITSSSIIVLVVLLSLPACAADWPASLEVGGFSITGVAGATNADGSGKATGKLAIPGDGNCQVDLAKTAAGVVTGSTRASVTLGGVRVDGSFMLDRRGLQGTGTIRTGGKPISDANITVTPKGGANAHGRVSLAPDFAISVQCDLEPGRVDVKGSGARRVMTDTPLAVYTFKGDVDVTATGTNLKTVAKGTVERKGKIGGGVSSFGPLAFDVDSSTGEAKLNVGGANITIDLW